MNDELMDLEFLSEFRERKLESSGQFGGGARDLG